MVQLAVIDQLFPEWQQTFQYPFTYPCPHPGDYSSACTAELMVDVEPHLSKCVGLFGMPDPKKARWFCTAPERRAASLCEIQNKAKAHTLIESLRREFPLVPGEGAVFGLIGVALSQALPCTSLANPLGPKFDLFDDVNSSSDCRNCTHRPASITNLYEA